MQILILIILVGIHLLLLNTQQFTMWPEMLSYSYLFSKGFVLYKDFIIPYPPGLILVLVGVLNLFGYTPETLKTFTWIMIVLEDILIYLIVRRIIKKTWIPFLFLLIFVPLQTLFDGNMLWFDFATVIPLLFVFWLTLKWLEQKRSYYFLLIGLGLSFAILIKQVALIYSAFFLLFYLFTGTKVFSKNSLLLVLGGLIPFIFFAGFLMFSSSFINFWLWTIEYPLTQWSKFPAYIALQISRREIITFSFLFFPTLGALLMIKNLKQNLALILSFLFLLGAILAVYPRFSLFHFQAALAFLIVLLATIYANFSIKYRLAYLILIIISTVLTINLVPRNFNNEIRFYGNNDKKIIEKISENTEEGEKIFLLGLDSSQYVFTKTLPPKNWSDNFGWYLEIPGVQEWVLEGMKNDKPRVIFRRTPDSGQWYELGVYQPKKILEYIQTNYNMEGYLLPRIEIWKIRN